MNLLANLDEVKLQMSIEIIEKYSSTDYDVFEAVSLLNDSKYYQETYKVLTNEYAIKAGIALEGAKIINESQRDFNAYYASIVLTDVNAIKVRIALYGAKITNESQHDFNAENAMKVLTNANAIEAGIVLDGAKIVNEADKEINAKYASAVLRNVFFMTNQLTLLVAQKVSKFKYEHSGNQECFSLSDRSLCEAIIKQSKKENIIDELISELESDSCKNVEPKQYIKKLCPKN